MGPISTGVKLDEFMKSWDPIILSCIKFLGIFIYFYQNNKIFRNESFLNFSLKLYEKHGV